MSWLNHNFTSIFSRGYSLDNDELRYAEKQRKISAFLRIPIELEKFLFYGTLQCLEAFCHLSTFLPIRLLVRLFSLDRLNAVLSSHTEPIMIDLTVATFR